MGEGDLIEDKVRLTGASEEGARGHIHYSLVVGWVEPQEDSQAWNCASVTKFSRPFPIQRS